MNIDEERDRGREQSHRSKRDELLISVLTSKAVSLGSEVTGLLPKMENFLGVVAAVLIGSVTLGAIDDHPVIFVVLPFPMMILYVYLLQSNTEMLARAGHKLFLERKINELLQEEAMLEEEYVAKTLHGRSSLGRSSIVLIQGTMVAVLLGVIVLGILNLSALHDTTWKIAFFAGLNIGMVNLAAAAWEQSNAYRNGYEAARRGFDKRQPPVGSSLLRD